MDQKLETFLTLCKTMHYGRAAELLHLSQPAVSKHIQALEAQYGVRLFTYQARRLQKTREGDLLEQYAFSLRYNEEMLLARLHEKSKTLLRIGATKSIGDYILLPEIRRFLAKPDQQLHFLVDNTAHLLAKLEYGELDFVVLEGLFDKQRYDFFLLREEPYLGICAADHPFAGKQIPIPDLFSERLILREEGSGTRKILERELIQSGYHVSAFSDCACISSFKLLKELVRENCGISFVYEAVVKDDPRFGSFSSASVSVGNALMATTHGSLYTFVMLLTCFRRFGIPFSRASRFSPFSSAFGTPPLYFRARTVATTTTAFGFRPAIRHLMSRNFSAPRSAPKPASVIV